MQQGLQNPIAGMGIVPTKGFLDFDFIARCQANAEDPRIAATCYPGGSTDQNHDAMPGDTSYGFKNVRNTYVAQGEPNELGFVSVAGLNWGQYCSQREMEEQIYWQGVVTTESRLTNPLDSATGDPEHGYGMIKAGTVSVINNGHKTIYAGNLIAWQLPAAPFHPRSGGRPFNDGSTINALARQGTPTGQFRPEYVPFDPTDFSVQLAAAFAAMVETSDNGGISDKGLVSAFPSLNGYEEKPNTGIQDEAAAYKYAFAGIALSVVETLLRNGLLVAPAAQTAGVSPAEAQAAAGRIAQSIGLWSYDVAEQGILLEAMGDIFMEHIAPIDARRNEAVVRFRQGLPANVDAETFAMGEPETPEHMYARLRYHTLEMLTQGITSSWHSKTSKIVARALNTAAPTETTHLLLGHVAL